MKPEEAQRKVTAALRQRQLKPLALLQHGNNTWAVPWDAVGGGADSAQLVRKAYAVGRTGSLLQRMQEQFLAMHGGTAIPLGLTADLEKLRAIVVNAAQAVDREPVEAAIVETGANLKVSADQPGLRTDVAATVQKVAQGVSAGSAVPIPMVVAQKPAAILAKDLQGIDKLIASFSTTFDTSDENRSQNIFIASEALSGALIKSGEIFSFNDRVGLRLPERGYLTAPTLSSSGVVMDWGGGVCQVSSTLYNAALLADFSVVERSAHYQPPSYVPLGQDATVADGQIDLKLKNARTHAAYVRSISEAGRLEIRIYGKMEGNATAVLIESTEKTVHVPQTIMKQDPTLPLGMEVVESEGRNSFVVTVQRIKKQGAREISREKISTDEFDGENRIVRVGTRTTGGQAGK
jgi:vancomycin resistance protein YoaR